MNWTPPITYLLHWFIISPSQSQVCAVVEAIFSYSVSADIIGDAMLYERAEKIAYNGLPGA